MKLLFFCLAVVICLSGCTLVNSDENISELSLQIWNDIQLGDASIIAASSLSKSEFVQLFPELQAFQDSYDNYIKDLERSFKRAIYSTAILRNADAKVVGFDTTEFEDNYYVVNIILSYNGREGDKFKFGQFSRVEGKWKLLYLFPGGYGKAYPFCDKPNDLANFTDVYRIIFDVENLQKGELPGLVTRGATVIAMRLSDLGLMVKMWMGTDYSFYLGTDKSKKVVDENIPEDFVKNLMLTEGMLTLHLVAGPNEIPNSPTTQEMTDPDGNVVVMRKRVQYLGKYFSDPEKKDVNIDGENITVFSLNITNGNAQGALGRLTGSNLNRKLGIVLDSKLIKVLTIKEKMRKSFKFPIEADSDIWQTIYFVIRSGALPCPVSEIEHIR